MMCFVGAPHIFQIKYSANERQSWAFGNSKEDNNFADVTLACEDGQQVEAHKVILAGQVLFDKLCCFMLSNAVLSLQLVDLAVF